MSKHWMDSDEFIDKQFDARDREIAALKARLAEAERLLLDARDMIRAGIDDYDGVQEDALVGRIEAALAGAAVQPEGCCLDYPRCDCNSPPKVTP